MKHSGNPLDKWSPKAQLLIASALEKENAARKKPLTIIAGVDPAFSPEFVFATVRQTSTGPKVKKITRRRTVERTRNGGTITEAAFWGMVRSGLRRTFRFWKPALAALKAARVPCKGPRGQKWKYLCCDCQKFFLRKQVQIHHIEPVGTILDYGDVGYFLKKLTPEDPKAFKVLCVTCHRVHTNNSRDDQ